MPKNNICAYNGCDNSARKRPDLSFHRFPRDEERFKKWISLVGRNEWLQMEPQKMQNHRVCSAHFDKSDFVINSRAQGKPTLKCDVLPVSVSSLKSNSVASQVSGEPTIPMKKEFVEQQTEPRKIEDSVCAVQFDKRDVINNSRTQGKPSLSSDALPADVSSLKSNSVASQPSCEPTIRIKMQLDEQMEPQNNEDYGVYLVNFNKYDLITNSRAQGKSMFITDALPDDVSSLENNVVAIQPSCEPIIPIKMEFEEEHIEPENMQSHCAYLVHFEKHDLINNRGIQGKSTISSDVLPADVSILESNSVASQPSDEPTILIKFEFEEEKMVPQKMTNYQACSMYFDQHDLVTDNHSQGKSMLSSDPLLTDVSNVKNNSVPSQPCEPTIPIKIESEVEQMEAQRMQNHGCSVYLDTHDFTTNSRAQEKAMLSSDELPADACSLKSESVTSQSGEPITPIKLASCDSGTTEASRSREVVAKKRIQPQLSWREQILTKKLATVKSKLKRSRQILRNLQRRRKKKLSAKDIIEGAAHFVSGDRFTLLKMQLEHIKLSPWSEDEKQLALDLFHKFPKAYVYLREKKSISLPCVTSIRQWANDLKSKTDNNPEVIDFSLADNSTFD